MRHPATIDTADIDESDAGARDRTRPIDAAARDSVGQTLRDIVFAAVLWFLASIALVIAFSGWRSGDAHEGEAFLASSVRTAGHLVALGDAAAPWLIPMFVTTLVAALALLILPAMRPNFSAPEIEDWNEIRRYLAQLASVFAAIYGVWMLWVILAWMWPGLPSGSNGVGIVLGALPVLGLAVFIGRYRRGTPAQRRADLVEERRRLRVWTDAVAERAEISKAQKWVPVVIAAVAVLGVVAAVTVAGGGAVLAGVIFAAAVSGLPLLAAVALIGRLGTPIAFERLGHWVLAWLLAGAGIAIGVQVAVTADWSSPWGMWVAMLAVVLAIVPFLLAHPWSMCHLDAVWAPHARRRLERREGELDRAVDALKPAESSTRRRRQRWWSRRG